MLAATLVQVEPEPGPVLAFGASSNNNSNNNNTTTNSVRSHGGGLVHHHHSMLSTSMESSPKHMLPLAGSFGGLDAECPDGVSFNDRLYTVAHGAMDRRTLRFHIPQLEMVFRDSQLRRFFTYFKVLAALSLPWILAIGTPILLAAVSQGTGAIPVASAVVFGVSMGLSVALVLALWCLPKARILAQWNVLIGCSSALFVIPIFLMLAVCVQDGVASVMDECTPQYPDLQPLLPVVLAMVAPHLIIPTTGCSWYVASLLSMSFCIVGSASLFAANVDPPVAWFVFAVLAGNVLSTTQLSYVLERQLRTAVWLVVANARGASALAQTEEERNGVTIRNDAFVTFATSSGQLLYELDQHDHFASIVGAGESLLGCSAAQLVGMHHSHLMHGDDKHAVAAMLAELRMHGYKHKPTAIQFRRIKVDNTIAWMEMVAVLEHGPTGPVLLASERDVSAEREAREAVALERQRRVAATAAQAAHDETLGYACHELRNPLHVIQASLAFLKETDIDEEQTEHMFTIDRAAKQMRTLVDDILDVDRLRAGKLEVKPVATNPGNLVRNAALQHRDFAHVPVLFDVGTDVPDCVLIAGDRVTQILNNGMTNAAKFTTSGRIRVRVQRGRKPQTLRFEVRNSGVLPNRPMFRAFESTASSTVNAAKGTGLGLRISASLVVALGGELNLENVPVLEQLPDLPEAKTETAFWFEIPFSVDSSLTVLQSPATFNERRFSLGGPINLGLHVMYVDDEPMNRRIGQAMLTKLGCTFVILEDGDQVLDNHPESFDVILLDIVMQRMHGDEVMRKLVAAGIRTPCFAVSGNTDQASIQSYLRAGFREVVGKPFTIENIRRLLQPFSVPKLAPFLPGEV